MASKGSKYEVRTFRQRPSRSSVRHDRRGKTASLETGIHGEVVNPTPVAFVNRPCTWRPPDRRIRQRGTARGCEPVCAQCRDPGGCVGDEQIASTPERNDGLLVRGECGGQPSYNSSGNPSGSAKNVKRCPVTGSMRIGSVTTPFCVRLNTATSISGTLKAR